MLFILIILYVRQIAKSRHWKSKNKEIHRQAIIEKHTLQHEIDQLKANRFLFERLGLNVIRLNPYNPRAKIVERYFKGFFPIVLTGPCKPSPNQ